MIQVNRWLVLLNYLKNKRIKIEGHSNTFYGKYNGIKSALVGG